MTPQTLDSLNQNQIEKNTKINFTRTVTHVWATILYYSLRPVIDDPFENV